MNHVQAMWASFRAEFLKIWSFRFPLYAGGGLILFVGLVTFNLIRAEGLLSHLQVTDAISILPHLAWASWGKLVVIPVFLIAFATYCTVVDSQYGMIRIGCSQPVTRMGYAAAKTAAILAHSAILMLAYAALLLGASAVTVGRWTVTWNEVVHVLVFCERLLILGVGIAWLVTAAALIRRTLLSGFVTAVMVIFGFAWLNVLPVEYGLRPYLLFRYFLYPLLPIWPKEFSMVEIPNANAATWQFLITVLGTPALCWVAAVTYFEKRDITE